MPPGKSQVKYQRETFSEVALDLIAASWRLGTEKSYNSAWKLWSSWCDQRDISPFPTTITLIVEFITHHFQTRKTVLHTELLPFSPLSHNSPNRRQTGRATPLVCRALQGSFNRRPPGPRYTTTWDVTLVVCFIQENMGDNQPLSLTALPESCHPASVNQCYKGIEPGGFGR